MIYRHGTRNCCDHDCFWGFPGISDGKEAACKAEDLGWIPGSWRSPGEGNGNPLRYYCLGNPMDRGAWRAAVHGVCFYEGASLRRKTVHKGGQGKKITQWHHKLPERFAPEACHTAHKSLSFKLFELDFLLFATESILSNKRKWHKEIECCK